MKRSTLAFILLLIMTAALPLAVAFACSCGNDYQYVAYGVLGTTDDRSTRCAYRWHALVHTTG